MTQRKERVRFNSRARQSSHKQRKSKKAKTSHEDDGEAVVDSNAVTLVLKSEEQKQQERRERLKAELIAQQESKISSKKKRRLEKYIEKKLRKEERVHLFEKLAQSQAEIPSSLVLQSSATLGSAAYATHEELQAKKEDRQVRRAMQKRKHVDVESGSEDDESAEEEDEHKDHYIAQDEEPGSSRASPVVIPKDDDEAMPQSGQLAEVGSALKRGPDGKVIAPRVIKRKPKGKRTAFPSWENVTRKADRHEDEEEGSSSFDSSAPTDDEDEEDEDVDQEDNGDSQVEAGLSDGNEESEGSEEDSGDENEDESNEDEPEPPKKKERKFAAFKEWATGQLNASKGYTQPVHQNLMEGPSVVPFTSEPSAVPSMPTASMKPLSKDEKREMRGPLGEDYHLPNSRLAETLKNGSSMEKKRSVVQVSRPPDVQEARLKLPVVAEEQTIVETILLNPVVVICGETGSGKTTQVPQFLYEAGFGSPESDNPGIIGITQPRRVAAMSMAARVGHELGLGPSRVSYQIRYDVTVSPTTTIKFMTDGVLLRELATDFLLTKYSVIIIDEAHERNINTDILIGVLSRVMKLREELWASGKDSIKPLRLIIMSATLRVDDFVSNTTLFPNPPPVIDIAARQHPVTVHFSRRTQPDYVTEAIKKTSKIHTKLPPGGVLVFMTGQNEITGLCRKLETKFGRGVIEAKKRRRSAMSANMKVPDAHAIFGNDKASQQVNANRANVEVEDIDFGLQEAEILDDDLDDDGGLDDEALESDEELGLEESDVPMHILPLYSLLPADQQMRVFEPPPEGSRLVVVATNVAETSLTIPGIRYVVDCGRAKERHYDIATGIQTFRVSWISKASAVQRAGRAGRTGPGHCYRLYSSSLFEHHFDKFAQPEILRTPIEGIVLQMKGMNIDAVTNFPFPTPPDRDNLKKAEKLLTYIGALRSPNVGLLQTGGQITEIGKSMSVFPLAPRYARMLVSSRQHGCLPYAIVMVSALSVGDPFLREENLLQSKDEVEEDDELAESHEDEQKRARRRAFFQSQELHSRLGGGKSDVFRLLSVVGAYEYAGGGHQICRDLFVRPKAMEEVHKLRGQISNITKANWPEAEVGFENNLKPPSDPQLKVLRQLLCAALIDQVAIRKDLVERSSSSGIKYATCRGVPYQALGIEEDVFVHPSSILFNQKPPEYIVFQDVIRSSKVWVKTLTVINPTWLAQLGKDTLCTFSKPMNNSAGEAMIIPRFGPRNWELSAMKAKDLK